MGPRQPSRATLSQLLSRIRLIVLPSKKFTCQELDHFARRLKYLAQEAIASKTRPLALRQRTSLWKHVVKTCKVKLFSLLIYLFRAGTHGHEAMCARTWRIQIYWYRPRRKIPAFNYEVSNFIIINYSLRNSGAQNWSPSKGTRFKSIENKALYETPPPGTYTPNDRDQHNHYILSNFKTLGVKTIRQKFQKGNDSLYPRTVSMTPGPGTYETTSEFGITQRLRAANDSRFGISFTATGGPRPLYKRQSTVVDSDLNERMDQLRLTNNRSV